LIDSAKNEENLANQYSILSSLNIMKANFYALSTCAVSLPDMMKSKEGAYESFLKTYRDTVVRMVERGYSEDFSGSEEVQSEMKCLWRTIKQSCVDIMAMSINLLYASSDQIIDTLYTHMKDFTDPKEGSNCSIYLDYLTVPENSKKIFKTEEGQDADQRMKNVIS